MSGDGRKRQWIAVPVDFAGEPMMCELVDEFGWNALSVWVLLQCAAKRSLVEGQVSYSTDADLLSHIGMDSSAMVRDDGSEWSMDDYFRVTGRYKHTTRTRRGRRSYVTFTRFAEIQKVRATQANTQVNGEKYEQGANAKDALTVTETKTVTKTGHNPPTPHVEPDLFAEQFWPAYPRKVSKPNALKAWKNATKRAEPAEIMAALSVWVAYWEAKNEPEFIPHPATWLNQERWNDEPPPLPSSKRRRNETEFVTEAQSFLAAPPAKELSSGVA